MSNLFARDLPHAMFAEQFQKDLRFFQLLLLLINKSCPIKNVDLVWADIEPETRANLRDITGTAQALKESSSHLLCLNAVNPNPRFCETVSNHGKDLCCIKSDKAAEERVRKSGRTEVYRCHAGLIDIAVPVFCEGRHIATLYSGQILTTPPSSKGFVQIRNAVRELKHVDLKELESAYHEVPVVTEEDIQRTVGILEMFADYLATAWKRLHEAVEGQHRRIRDAQLSRKEMAHIILDGDVADRGRLRELSRSVGFSQYPNRILVVKPQPNEERSGSGEESDLVLTRVLYAIEELTGKSEDVMVAHLRRHGICVFFADCDRGAGLGNVKAYALAQRIISAVATHCDIRVRVGIGRTKGDLRRLAESYQEAKTALMESQAAISVYKKPAVTARELSAQVTLLCKALSERRLADAKVALQKVSVLANRYIGDRPEHAAAQRQFFISTLEAMAAAAQAFGSSKVSVHTAEALDELEVAHTVLDLQASWENSAIEMISAVGALYAGKHEKIIERARAIIDERMRQDEDSPTISLAEVSAACGVSAGHLSRTFKRVTGCTFERYLMVKRVERAQRLLLDPLSRVSEVAEKCDFCNPAYFARVFRKVVGCSPTDYSKNPIVFAGRPDGLDQREQPSF